MRETFTTTYAIKESVIRFRIGKNLSKILFSAKKKIKTKFCHLIQSCMQVMYIHGFEVSVFVSPAQ